jgi:hypothetical protein
MVIISLIANQFLIFDSVSYCIHKCIGWMVECQSNFQMEHLYLSKLSMFGWFSRIPITFFSLQLFFMLTNKYIILIDLQKTKKSFRIMFYSWLALKLTNIVWVHGIFSICLWKLLFGVECSSEIALLDEPLVDETVSFLKWQQTNMNPVD